MFALDSNIGLPSYPSIVPEAKIMRKRFFERNTSP